jgi:aryl-alcohol dehydrogenase-like predicted oxidoreductase
MKKRNFVNTGGAVSEIGLGCWQLGADWGHVSDNEALSILETAVDSGVTFFDTADVYGAGRSETLIAKFLRGRQEDVFVATKIGRKNYPGPYTHDTMRQHIDDCRRRLGVDALDLVQLHCIPPAVMASGEVFDSLRTFKQEGLIKNFGASVESMDEALMILEQPGLTSLQIIFNIFRQKPIHTLFDKAMAQNVGIIVRLPLASGLLAGKFTGETKFAKDDHRNYNADDWLDFVETLEEKALVFNGIVCSSIVGESPSAIDRVRERDDFVEIQDAFAFQKDRLESARGIVPRWTWAKLRIYLDRLTNLCSEVTNP